MDETKKQANLEAPDPDPEHTAKLKEERHQRGQACAEAAAKLRAAVHGQQVLVIAVVGAESVVSLDVAEDLKPEGQLAARTAIRTFLADHLAELLRSDHRA